MRLVFAYEVDVSRGLRLAFDGDDGEGEIGRFGGQIGEAHAELVLPERASLASLAQLCGLHLRHQSGDGDLVSRPEMDVHVEGVAGARQAAVVGAANLTGIFHHLHALGAIGVAGQRRLGRWRALRARGYLGVEVSRRKGQRRRPGGLEQSTA